MEIYVLCLWTASDLKQMCCSSTIYCNINGKEKINNHANVTIYALICICGHRCWALTLTIHVMLRDVRWNIMQMSQSFPLARSSDLHPTKPLTLRLHFDQEMVYYKEFFKEKKRKCEQLWLKMEQMAKRKKKKKKKITDLDSREDEMYNHC